MKILRRLWYGMLALTASGAFIAGCSGSEEASRQVTSSSGPSATEIMQREISDLRTENNTLKLRTVTLEQEKRNASARAAELETELMEMQSRMTEQPPVNPPAVIGDASTAYERALRLFQERKYSEAAAAFQNILRTGPPPRLDDNCHYWLGECAFAQRRYSEAIEHFRQVFSFDISEKKDDAQMMIANAYLAVGDALKAKEEYQILIRQYPASPYIKKAKEKLGKL